MSTAPKLLAVDNVTTVFTIGGGFHRVRLRAVEEASFALPREPEIFLGWESGCGKTTGPYDPGC